MFPETNYSNLLRFEIAGSERAVLSSSGLGIGTSAPASLIELKVGASDDTAQLSFNRDGYRSKLGPTGDPSSDAEFQIKYSENRPLTFYTNNSERARLTSTGKFGIGTLSPSTELDVVGSIHASSHGDFDGNLIVGGSGTFTGSVSGGSGSFSGPVSGTTGTFSSSIFGTSGSFTKLISGTHEVLSAGLSAATANFSSGVTANAFYGDGLNLTDLNASNITLTSST